MDMDVRSTSDCSIRGTLIPYFYRVCETSDSEYIYFVLVSRFLVVRTVLSRISN